MSSHILNQNLRQNKSLLQLKIETQRFSWKELVFLQGTPEQNKLCAGYQHSWKSCGMCWITWKQCSFTLGGSVGSKVLSCFDAIFLKPNGSQPTDLSGPSIALGTFSSFIKNEIRSWIKCNIMSAVLQFQHCQIGTRKISHGSPSIAIGLLSLTSRHVLMRKSGFFQAQSTR